jgi:hypothetical protein
VFVQAIQRYHAAGSAQRGAARSRRDIVLRGDLEGITDEPGQLGRPSISVVGDADGGRESLDTLIRDAFSARALAQETELQTPRDRYAALSRSEQVGGERASARSP